MSAPLRRYPLALVLVIGICSPRGSLLGQRGGDSLPSIAVFSSNYQRSDGFVPLVIDDSHQKLWMELPDTGLRLLMMTSLASGLGSNPIGLDRGANGGSYVVRFERGGTGMLMVFENWRYRTSGNELHAKTVRESFAESTILALPVVAASSGRVLVDATTLVQRDWNGITATLQSQNEGSYTVAKDRTRLYDKYTIAYPSNSEIDVEMTFGTNGRPGRTVNRITPDGSAFTMRQHISLMQLPDDGFRVRDWDPRTGYFGTSWNDYGQPLQGRLTRRVANRHRLTRSNPSDPNSPIAKPIIYYVDPGIPEPVRSATFEGAKWWEEAFDRAGLKGGFKVEWLPSDADPMDARYNVVQWENRNERGWSVGGSLSDPRTGEILKGMARLDSHRARTDYNIFAALMGASPTDADTALILARVRQVTSHEIGHTLGLAHNYIASSYGRGSVMDYPAPRARVVDNQIDLSDAYDSGPGDFDVWAIRWGYGIFPEATEVDSLEAIVSEGLKNGWLFLSDGDARPTNSADPRTNLWDDGATASQFLQDQLEVRRVAMAQFGLRNIAPGEPVSMLQERFPFVYFWHRYAVSALAKAIGGLEYQNAVNGDGQTVVRPLPSSTQRVALKEVMATLDPAVLAIPDTVLRLLGPGSGPDGSQVFRSRTSPMFDELGAAQTLARLVLDAVLDPARAARLIAMSARDPAAPTLNEVVETIRATTWSETQLDRHASVLRRITGRALVDQLLVLAANKSADQQVRDVVELKLSELAAESMRRAGATDEASAKAHWRSIYTDITRWLERRELPAPTPALPSPPFDPF